ncbi:MAG: hypothetical protein JXB36_20785, partial [Gammaproteobacteria bacterium]|nr:hypothetical protein [Gammaproteobacteria bacterium]
EQRRFEREREAVPEEAQYMINNKASDLLALASGVLDAQMEAAAGNTAAAVDAWRRAVELEAAIQYDEPPAWFYPVRQSLAAALLRDGRPAEAEALFRETLAKYPRDGRLLYGLWQSLVAQDKDEARLVEAQHRTAWSTATEPLAIDDL